MILMRSSQLVKEEWPLHPPLVALHREASEAEVSLQPASLCHHFLSELVPQKRFKTVSPTLFPETQTVFQSRSSTALPDWGDGKRASQPLQHCVIRGGRHEACHYGSTQRLRERQEQGSHEAPAAEQICKERRSLQRAVHQRERERSAVLGWHLHHLRGHPLEVDVHHLLPRLPAVVALLRLRLLAGGHFPRGLRERHPEVRLQCEQLHRGLPVLHWDSNHYWLRLQIRDRWVPCGCFHGGFPKHCWLHYWRLHHWCRHGKDGKAQEEEWDFGF